MPPYKKAAASYTYNNPVEEPSLPFRGMGNQMFVYALYKALQHAGKQVCIEDFTHYGDIGHADGTGAFYLFPVRLRFWGKTCKVKYISGGEII